MELTPDDLARAGNLGMDHAEDENNSGTRTPPLYAAELWTTVMGTAPKGGYPADAVSHLRDSYNRGRMDYY
ncbi:hypothetical protein HD599_003237 [Conyzicola lurida]|uniref:Uncharacterized protein n=1 Tax=Conyzicola lurida TaxID=1172621 RepID=A0A841ARL3_9MICO|nr:hypothetical protein [Conyzicola lurida]MBB5844914.1 hypothetical protein [Conyzicola lurida]